MSIVYGFYQADSGTISINGNIINLKSPRDSIENGIGMVHQHFMLVENFSVLENIILGFEGEIIFGKKLEEAKVNLLKLCDKYENLEKFYNLRKNKGYGTEAHRKGIQEYGITQWHRKSFCMCKNY